jgi:hypothetical protein
VFGFPIVEFMKNTVRVRVHGFHELYRSTRHGPYGLKYGPSVRRKLALLSRIPVEHAENVGHIARRGQRPVAERAARQPESERTCDGESDGREGVGEVALRPRARPHEGHFAVRSRGGNAASALR